MRIRGKTVLITGASSGIGAATAKAMARAGGRVLLLARTQAALEKIASCITASGREAWSYSVDLANAEAVDQVAKKIKQEVGIPDQGARRGFRRSADSSLRSHRNRLPMLS